MKRALYLLFTLTVALCSCGDGEEKGSQGDRPSKEELKEKITYMEDSIKGLTARLKEIKQIPNLTRMELINRLLDYYHYYPEDPYSAQCLDKVHMAYSGMNVQVRAVQYADTLLEKYPDYVNRAMVLESQGSSYDIFIQPRDSAKVRYYYELLLKENPKMEKDKREGIKDRLKHNNLTFDEYIEYKMNTVVLN